MYVVSVAEFREFGLSRENSYIVSSYNGMPVIHDEALFVRSAEKN